MLELNDEAEPSLRPFSSLPSFLLTLIPAENSLSPHSTLNLECGSPGCLFDRYVADMRFEARDNMSLEILNFEPHSSISVDQAAGN